MTRDSTEPSRSPSQFPARDPRADDSTPTFESELPPAGAADPAPTDPPADDFGGATPHQGLDTVVGVPDPALVAARAREPGAPDIPHDPTGRARHPGLGGWIAFLEGFAIGAAIGRQEAAGLVALALIFVLAQAADLEIRWRKLYHLISWVIPAFGALGFALLTTLLGQSDLTGPLRSGMVAFTGACAVLCVVTGLRPVSNAMIRVLFPSEPPTHTLRLTSRLVAFALLSVAPTWVLFHQTTLMEESFRDIGSMLGVDRLGGQLFGYVMLALASVGFRVRRSFPATLARLGLTKPTPAQAVVVVLGVAGLYAFNSGTEWLQRTWFPDLWQSDREVLRSMAGSLTAAQVLVLGLSAGIGEEITMRGALQPRLGLVLTSVLFAALHVQYSWYGMLVVMVLGLILGLVRKTTSTTVAIAIHSLYDVLAAAFTPGS